MARLWHEDLFAAGLFATDLFVEDGEVAAPPEIVSIVPADGPDFGGTEVLITGTGFDPEVEVTFDGNDGIVQLVTATTIVVVTPPGTAGAVDVVVTNPDAQDDTAVNGFTYVAVPVGSGTSAGAFGRIAGVVSQSSGGYIPQRRRRRHRR